jgi:aminomethyltransferase
LEKGPFVGSSALAKVRAEGGPARKLVGLEIIERGIARDGYGVFDDQGRQIGYVTSGSPAPFLKKNIALAYLPPSHAAIDSEVFVQVRSNMVRAKVVPLPFYRRSKKQR